MPPRPPPRLPQLSIDTPRFPPGSRCQQGRTFRRACSPAVDDSRPDPHLREYWELIASGVMEGMGAGVGSPIPDDAWIEDVTTMR